MQKQWTIKSVLDWTADDFSQRQMPSARLEAELLLCHLLQEERIYLYTHFDRPLYGEELSRFRQLVSRRRNGECTAHITGIKEFWSLEFEVTHDVLVPRPDTETLVQAAVDVIDGEAMILDLCTGSGCVAVAVASECAGVKVHATDVSESALEVAKRNVVRHKLEDRIHLFKGDLFDAVTPGSRYDVIVSNPPYVVESELPSLSAEVQNEPRLALVGGGKDGLDIPKQILQQAAAFLKKGGHLLMELDDFQSVHMARELGPQLLGQKGWTLQDLAGKNRVVAFCFSGREA